MFAAFWGRNRVLLVAGAALTVIAVVATIALVVLRPRHVVAPARSSGSAAVSAVTTSTTDTNRALIGLGRSPAVTSPAYLPGSDPTYETLVGGQTNQLVVAEKVASAVFSYGPATDFQARNTDIMEVALPSPGSTAGGTVGSRSASQWAEQGTRVWSSLRERTSMKKQIVVVR